MVPMAIGATIGSFIGGKLLNHIEDRYLRLIFLIVVTYLIVQMIYKGVVVL
jgi:uncharacterized membrane protein YfcA